MDSTEFFLSLTCSEKIFIFQIVGFTIPALQWIRPSFPGRMHGLLTLYAQSAILLDMHESIKLIITIALPEDIINKPPRDPPYNTPGFKNKNITRVTNIHCSPHSVKIHILHEKAIYMHVAGKSIYT